MDINIEQKIYNVYRHHDEDVLHVISGPLLANQIICAKEYIHDVLHIIISNYQYEEDLYFCFPETDLYWLNSIIKNLKRNGLFNKLIISNNDTEIRITTNDLFNTGLSELYDLLVKIFKKKIIETISLIGRIMKLKKMKNLH